MNGEQLQELIESHLKRNGNQILVIGARTTNFPPDFRKNKRLVFWDSVDPDTFHKQRIPEHVTLILFTRFVPHSLFEKVKTMAPKGVEVVRYVQGTGAIKRYLRKEVMAMAMATAGEAGGESADPGFPGGDAARDSPATTPAPPGDAEPSPAAPSGEPAPAPPRPEDELLGRIVNDPGLSELAMQKFLEDCREWRKEAASVPDLKAENKQLREEIEGLRKYRQFLAGLKDLLRETEQDSV